MKRIRGIEGPKRLKNVERSREMYCEFLRVFFFFFF